MPAPTMSCQGVGLTELSVADRSLPIASYAAYLEEDRKITAILKVF